MAVPGSSSLEVFEAVRGMNGIFDVKPYLHIGKLSELNDKHVFDSVRVSFDTIEWDNGADLDPELLYEESTPAYEQHSS